MTSRPGLLLSLALTVLSGCIQQAPFVAITDAVGKVSSADGFPSVTRNARPYILDEQSLIYAGDVLRTDGRSRLTVVLTSTHELTLSPDSQLLLTKVEQRDNEIRLQFSLTAGAAEVSQNTSKQIETELTARTNIAEVSSLTGDFWLGYERDGTELTVIALSNGGVIVSNMDGQVDLTEAFQTTSISAGSAPGAMTTWSEDRVRRTIRFYLQIQ